MASFQIHDDQENALPINNILRKETNEANKNQRRALGGINPNTTNQQRILKSKLQTNDVNIRNNENRARAVSKRDKTLPSSQSSVIPPVAQFEAFSVYEEKPEEQEQVPKEPTKVHAKKVEKHIPPSVLNLHTQRHPLQEKIKDVIPESPMSVGLDTSLCPMSITKSEVKEPEEEKKATAKTVRELFFHVAEYRDDIYKYMRDIEWKHRPKAGYMRKQPDISHSMRAILVDWLVEVGEEYRLQTETLYLAVSYIDRFLSYMSVVRAKLQLVGTAAMFIASKYEEIYPPDLGEFVYITDDTYTKQQVLRMEHLILKVLSFDLSTPTPLAFISHFCIANGLSQKTLYMAMYISELALLEAEPYLHFPSSILAASALLVARHAVLCCHCEGGSGGDGTSACEAAAWPEQLRRSSGYSPAQLERCVRQLERTHSAAPTLPQRAIPDKYKSSKYEGVSHIEAKPMYPVGEQIIDEKLTSFNKKLNDSDGSLSSSQTKQIDLNESGKKSGKES